MNGSLETIRYYSGPVGDTLCWYCSDSPERLVLPCQIKEEKNNSLKVSCFLQNPRCSKSHSAFDLFLCLVIFSPMYLKAMITRHSKEEINGRRFTILQR